ncbi:meiotic nuclear division protein 1 homolog isoform X2 [Saccoglossus kowalevskii]
MMEIFFEKKDFFQLKELEKIGPKEKGITSMSVKDVVQSLVDDGMVDTDKIGTSIYFWAFPSKASQNCKRKIEELSERLEESEKKRNILTERIEEAQKGREDSVERTQCLKELQEKEKQKSHFLSELEMYKECDPEVLKEIQNETGVAKEAVNRWTDNVFNIKSWCKKKFGFEENVIDKQFGIPEEFDYLD